MSNVHASEPTRTAKQVNAGDVMVIKGERVAVQKTETTLLCCGGGSLIHLSLKALISGRETYATFRPDEKVGELVPSDEASSAYEHSS